MKKKSIYFIAILIPLIFILGMFMFRLVIPKSCLGSDIRKTIDFEIDLRLKRGFDVNYNNVYLMFYSVDNVQYLSIYFTNRYEPARFKGLCIYRDKTIIYEGIDNNIAKKYICIKALSMTEPDIDPKYIGFNDSDPRVEYYRISNNGFIKFKPSEEHIDSIINKLIILNYLQAPPRPVGYLIKRQNKGGASGGIFEIPPSLAIRIFNSLNFQIKYLSLHRI